LENHESCANEFLLRFVVFNSFGQNITIDILSRAAFLMGTLQFYPPGIFETGCFEGRHYEFWLFWIFWISLLAGLTLADLKGSHKADFKILLLLELHIFSNIWQR
jgi:hypothetical protein